MLDYGPESFGDRAAEQYDTWYGNPSEAQTQQTVDVLEELARGGSVLELAVGTGRIAIPLARRGLAVSGIDASPAMLEKLQQKPDGGLVGVQVAEMSDFDVDSRFDLIVLVFNTLFNLRNQDQQVQCFRHVARHLTGSGLFVIEAFVPNVARYTDGQDTRTVHLTTGSAIIEASIHDPITQTIEYQYIQFGVDGVRLFPLPMRYAWPSELDLMARLAGLELKHRWNDWDRAPFTAASSKHVSVYGQAMAGRQADE